jgi:hypothetical protein
MPVFLYDKPFFTDEIRILQVYGRPSVKGGTCIGIVVSVESNEA